MVRARRRIAIWLAWFVVLNVVWLALVATLNWQEEIAGVISAAIGATAAEAVQAQGLIQGRLKLRWLAGLWMVPRRVVGETWLVFAVLARAPGRRERGRGRRGSFSGSSPAPSSAESASGAASSASSIRTPARIRRTRRGARCTRSRP